MVEKDALDSQKVMKFAPIKKLNTADSTSFGDDMLIFEKRDYIIQRNISMKRIRIRCTIKSGCHVIVVYNLMYLIIQQFINSILLIYGDEKTLKSK